MVQLDSLVNEQFRAALKDNYGLKPLDEFKDDVVRVIEHIPSVADESVDFIKCLTKAGSLILPELSDSALVNLIRYNAEGAHSATRAVGKPVTNIIQESHFDSHLSKTAQELSVRTQDTSFLALAHDAAVRSAQRVDGIDVKHAAYAYAIAANTGQLLYEATKQKKHLIAAESLTSEAADIFSDFDYGQAASCHFHGASIAKKLHSLTKDISWLEREFAHKKERAELNKGTDIADSAFDEAADCAKDLHEKTGKQTWLSSYFTAKFSAAESAKQLKRPHARFMYTYAGNAAKDMFEITKNKSWMQKNHECYVASASLSEGIDAMHAGHSHLFAANAANILFKNTKDSFWKDNAIRHYQRALFLLEENNANPGAIQSAKSALRYLV